MTVTVTQFTSLATRIRDILDTALVAAGLVNPGVVVYDHEPYDFDLTSAITIDGPDFTRRAVDEADSTLGYRDWTTDWKVRIYVKDDSQDYPVMRLRQITAIVIAAIDNDPTLKGTGVTPGVIDAVVHDGTQFSAQVGSTAQQAVGIECSLRVFQLT